MISIDKHRKYDSDVHPKVNELAGPPWQLPTFPRLLVGPPRPPLMSRIAYMFCMASSSFDDNQAKQVKIPAA
ncbi:hypothetical protein EVAR_49541_1 [Eumeta japonica]|uniref:Uncharacterized protein n=1 Tax=Eumeta variegata TaxID=151549 RepID=A0A4C1XJ86_EUMVA|nr:hypothetical protein EVAR_49541_1 [Eumeta japonica]